MQPVSRGAARRLLGCACLALFAANFATLASSATPPQDQPPIEPTGGFSATNSHWLHDEKSDCWIYYHWSTKNVVGVSWSGACADHQATGPGTLTIMLKTGHETYSGSFVAGKINGPGSALLLRGERLEGNFRDGMLNGSGTTTWRGGTRYEGEYVNQRFQGMGKLSWPNGDFYEGEFFDGSLNGKGKITYADGRRIEARFVGGQVRGDVTIRMANGTRLEGEFVSPLPDPLYPSARPSFPTSDLTPEQRVTVALRYCVEKDGSVDQVSFIEKSGIDPIDKMATDTIGHWHLKPATVAGVPIDYKLNISFTIGRGVKDWAHGGHYEGDLLDERFGGQGKVTWPGGDRYVGSFRDGLEDGYGVYTGADGVILEGEFQRGLISGHGVLRKPDGTRIEGEFVPPHPDPATGWPPVEYPVEAQRQNKSGNVLVRFRVGIDGSVRNARILIFSGTPELDDEAIAEVFRSHLVPGTLNGKPIELDDVREIVFQLQ